MGILVLFAGIKAQKDKKYYEIYKSLYEKYYVAKSDLDLAEATYKSDLAQIAAAQGTINQAQATLNNNLTNLRYTKIVSPVDGIVVSRAVDVGQTVATHRHYMQI